MDTNSTKYLITRVASLKNRIGILSGFVKENYDELKFFRDKILQKGTSNTIEEQVKNDVLLNLDKMMNSVQEELLCHIAELDSEISSTSDLESLTYLEQLSSRFEKVSLCMSQMAYSISDLRRRAHHFLKRQEFGSRHGYYSLFYEY